MAMRNNVKTVEKLDRKWQCYSGMPDWHMYRDSNDGLVQRKTRPLALSITFHDGPAYLHFRFFHRSNESLAALELLSFRRRCLARGAIEERHREDVSTSNEQVFDPATNDLVRSELSVTG
jgi:hypothetical protein